MMSSALLASGRSNLRKAGAGSRPPQTAFDRAPGLTGRALDDFARKDYLDTYSKMKPNLATIQDAVAHIDHVVKLVGVDHVGIGSDWDGISSVPAGLEDVSKMPHLTAALLEYRGQVVAAPAMHSGMWEHPATRDNLEALRTRGVRVIDPEAGEHLDAGDRQVLRRHPVRRRASQGVACCALCGSRSVPEASTE